MKFKSIKPFVMEFVTFVFVIVVILTSFLVGNFIEIRVKMHLLTVAALIVVTVVFIALFSRVVNTGVKALVDFALQRIKEDTYVFLLEQPYKASIFAEKCGHSHERSVGMYYLIQAKKDDEVFTFISPIYLELVEGKAYIITSGRSSHIIVNSQLYDK